MINKCDKCICNRCLNNVNCDKRTQDNANMDCFNCDSCYYYCYNYNHKKRNKSLCENYCATKPRLIIIE